MELLERLKKQQYVSVIWTCLVRCHFWKNHPRYSRWVNDVKKTFFVCENGIQVSHRISSRMGEHRIRKPTATSCCLSQACKQLMTRPELWVTGSRHKLWATTSWKWKQIYQNGFNHSRKDWRGDLQFWHVSPADVDIPPPALPSAPPPAKPTSNKAWGKHNSSTHFCKDPNCEVCRRPKVTRAPCKRNPDDWSDRIEIAARFGDTKTADHKVLNEEQESRMHHNHAVVVQGLATQWIQSYPCKSKSAQETQRSLRTFLHTEGNPRSIYTDNSLEFVF